MPRAVSEKENELLSSIAALINFLYFINFITKAQIAIWFSVLEKNATSGIEHLMVLMSEEFLTRSNSKIHCLLAKINKYMFNKNHIPQLNGLSSKSFLNFASFGNYAGITPDWHVLCCFFP